MSRKFGIRWDGLEQTFEDILKNHLKDKRDYVFLEIGFAHGATHLAVRDIIAENIESGAWLTIGLDLLNSADVNFKQINQLFWQENDLLVNRFQGEKEIQDKLTTGNYHSILVLRDDPRGWIKQLSDNSLDFVFIDGCHGKKCVMEDFIAIEPKVKPNGLVAFHDCGDEETGTDWQSHCNEYINVKNAIIELGLFDKKRPGWKIFTELSGTRKINKDPNGGNSLAIFQKL